MRYIIRFFKSLHFFAFLLSIETKTKNKNNYIQSTVRTMGNNSNKQWMVKVNLHNYYNYNYNETEWNNKYNKNQWNSSTQGNQNQNNNKQIGINTNSCNRTPINTIVLMKWNENQTIVPTILLFIFAPHAKINHRIKS